MRRLIILVLLSLAAVSVSNAQETSGDSLRININTLHHPSIYYEENFELDMPGFGTFYIFPDTTNVKLLSSFILSSMARNELFHLKSDTHMLTNYHKFYIENSRINTVTQILGMAQLSAAGYLAYKHIKKYGFK